MKALNFDSSKHIHNLLCRHKICTVRHGDKSLKYCEGEIVFITIGKERDKKKRVLTACLERILVKKLNQLSKEDVMGENPEFKTTEDLRSFLKRVYNKEISMNDHVTVIYFSEIIC